MKPIDWSDHTKLEFCNGFGQIVAVYESGSEMLVVYMTPNGKHESRKVNLDGTWAKARIVRRKETPLSGFVNIYPGEGYETKKEADAHAASTRIACIDLSQYVEGHGL